MKGLYTDSELNSENVKVNSHALVKWWIRENIALWPLFGSCVWQNLKKWISRGLGEGGLLSCAL